MTQGLNLRGTIWRINQNPDDEVGGFMATGTPVASNQPMGIFSRRPLQASLDQGLETEATYDATVKCGIVIYERDEVEVTCPTNSPHYGLRFRVMGVQVARRTRAGERHLTLSRIRQARRESW